MAYIIHCIFINYYNYKVILFNPDDNKVWEYKLYTYGYIFYYVWEIYFNIITSFVLGI